MIEHLKKMLLAEKGVVRIKGPDEEPFELKSGKRSRLFIDIKTAVMDPAILNRVVLEICQPGNMNFFCDMIASVAVGGVPIATALSLETWRNQVIVRSEKHDRGTKSQVIGNCSGRYCILIEDVATTGGSIVSAVKALHDAGATCDTCIVIVDREEGAQKLCRENGITLLSLLKKGDFGITEEI